MVVLVIIVGWFIANRLISPWRSVRIVEDVEVDGALATSASRLRVMTYNIAHGRGQAKQNWGEQADDHRSDRLADIALLIKDANADVVVLNEVDFDAFWSGHANQAQIIARLAGYQHRVEHRNMDASLPLFRMRFGNAVLSRYPIIEAKQVAFPGYRWWETLSAGKKQAAVCMILLPDGRRVRVLGVHLEHRSEAVRLASAKVIHELAASDQPILIATGDFNSTRLGYPKAGPIDGQTAVSFLLDKHGWLTAPGEQVRPTFPVTGPDREIDWIMIDPFHGGRVDHWRTAGAMQSDHLAVIAEIELPIDESK